jgi:hypothetical protein
MAQLSLAGFEAAARAKLPLPTWDFFMGPTSAASALSGGRHRV